MTRDCPSDEEIRKVLTGSFQEGADEQLARHLDTCGACRTRMDELAGRLEDHDHIPKRSADLHGTSKAFLRRLLEKVSNGEGNTSDAVSGRTETLSPAVLPNPLGGYEILEELGRGGMGIVFKARQVRLNRLVALKVLQSGELASLSELRRLQMEAEAVARLEHPNIVQVYEAGEHGTIRYLSMRFVEGTTLARFSQTCASRNAVWLRQSVRWLAAIARAVHYAHEQGILHRDVKPGNILVDARGQPYLTDFGLAKRTEGASSPTGHEVSLGTPQYASPEQLDSRLHEVTAKSDVYSLGAVLYELLTGRPPFEGNSPVAIVRQVLDRNPKSPRLINSAVNQDLSTICLKCLRKDPGDRYPSARAMAEDLERWLNHEPIRARPPTPMDQAVRFALRYPVGSALTVLLLSALVTGGFLVAQGNRSVRLALESEAQAREAEEVEREMKKLALHERLIERASAIRRSQALGRRFHAINLLQKAGEIRWSRELATEAAAALANFDLQERSRHSLPPLLVTETLRYGFLTLDDQLHHVVAHHPLEGLTLTPLEQIGERHRFEGTGQGLSPSIILSPDGRWFVCRRISTLELWRVDDERPKAEWPLQRTNVSEFPTPMEPIAFRGDNRMLAIPGERDGIRLVHLTRGMHQREVASGLKPTFMAFDPGGARLAVCHDHQVDVLLVETGRGVGSLVVPGEIRWLEWSPDGERIAVASRNHTPVELRDASSGQPVMTIGGSAPASRLAFHPDGRMLAVATDDKRVSLWELSRGTKLMEMEGGPRVLQFSKDGKRLAVAGTGNELFCYDVASSKVHREFLGLPGEHSESGYSLDVSSDGRLVVTADATSLRFWDACKGVEMMQLAQPSTLWTHLLFAPDDGALLVNPIDQGVFLRSFRWLDPGKADAFQLGEPEILMDAPYHGYWGLHARHSVVLAHREKEVQLWLDGDPRDRRVIAHLGDHCIAIPNLSTDGGLLSLTYCPGGFVEIWSVKDATRVCLLSNDFHTRAIFTPDNRYLLTATRSVLQLHKVQSWEAVGTVVDGLSRREFGCLSFSPDGRLLLAQSSDNSHRIYSWPELSEVIELTSPQTLSRHLCKWSDDGRRLYALGRGNRLYEWNLPLLCDELTRLGFCSNSWHLAETAPTRAAQPGNTGRKPFWK